MSDDKRPTLYLIPVTLAEGTIDKTLPQYNAKVLRSLKYFVVENLRTARRFMKAVDKSIDIDSLSLVEIDKHAVDKPVSDWLKPMSQGHDLGLLSEAGCPAVADPGADIVALAQKRAYNIEALVGPSSILLGLMSSGFNGQRFAFRGYLPIDDTERIATYKDMESRIYRAGETQIFIETPYRNERLFKDLLKHCSKETKLCIACDLTHPQGFARTLSIADWQQKQPEINKRPCIFLLYK